MTPKDALRGLPVRPGNQGDIWVIHWIIALFVLSLLVLWCQGCDQGKSSPPVQFARVLSEKYRSYGVDFFEPIVGNPRDLPVLPGFTKTEVKVSSIGGPIRCQVFSERRTPDGTLFIWIELISNGSREWLTQGVTVIWNDKEERHFELVPGLVMGDTKPEDVVALLGSPKLHFNSELLGKRKSGYVYSFFSPLRGGRRYDIHLGFRDGRLVGLII